MYALSVEKVQVTATSGRIVNREPSQRSLRWARVRTLGKAIAQGNDPALIVEHARELVDVLEGLEEWYYGPGFMRPVPAVALNDYQVALTYSLVLLALVRKTGSTTDRPGEPRFRDVQDRWVKATAEDLVELLARLAEVWASRLGQEFA